MTEVLVRDATIVEKQNFIYYVTEPCYNESSKPSEPVFISGFIYKFL